MCGFVGKECLAQCNEHKYGAEGSEDSAFGKYEGQRHFCTAAGYNTEP